MEQESNKWNKEGFVNLLITQAKGSDGNLKTWSSFSSRIRVSVTKVWTQMAFAYTGKGISGSGTDKGKHVTAMPIKDSRVCLRQPPSPRETLGGGGGALSDNPKNGCESAWWLAGCLEFDHIWEV